MTEAVATQGFTLPTITGAQTPSLNAAAVPPQNAQPGFVAGTPLPALPTAPQSTTELAAAVEKLTAAMAAKDAEPKVEPVEPDAKSLNTLDPNTLEDPTLRSMASAFKMLGAGLDFDRIFAKAIDAGDPKLLDIAYLREKAGANADGLVGLAESIVNFTNQQAMQQQGAVYALAGGESQWNAATAAFNANAPAEYKLAVRNLIDSGNKSNIEAGAKLVVQFATGQGYVPTPATMLNSGAGAHTGTGLDKSAFQTELQKLNPNDRDYNTKREELFARRRLGLQVGK